MKSQYPNRKFLSAFVFVFLSLSSHRGATAVDHPPETATSESSPSPLWLLHIDAMGVVPQPCSGRVIVYQ